MNDPSAAARRDDAARPRGGASARRRRVARGLLLAAALLLAADLVRPPQAQLSARAMLAAIDAYQATLSKALARAGARCRFEPTCSHYGEAVIRRHGALVGGAKAAWRVLRCGPWTPAGTVDPPPEEPQSSRMSTGNAALTRQLESNLERHRRGENCALGTPGR